MKVRYLIIVIVAMVSLSSCEKFFGEKTDKDFLDIPTEERQQVAYVPIRPVFEGFLDPVDIIIGYDELLYVADAGSEEIISYDLAGRQIGRFNIPGLKSVIQDRSMDLLAIGTFDTVINDQTYSLSTIYRINQKNNGYNLNTARITNKIVHPFYFKSGFSNADAEVSFQSLAMLPDNGFYVARSGPSNNTLQFGGPDDAVLEFSENDEYITPISVQTSTGSFRDFFKDPVSITTAVQPPQVTAGGTDGDFTIAMQGENQALKVVTINRIETVNGLEFRLENLPVGDTTKADGFLYTPFKFEEPGGITRAGDGTSYLFVCDAAKDSVYQFNREGYEGVQPPPAANSSKFIRASFGGNGAGLTQFNRPQSVAYFREILYVADAGNQRILRFQLTTDIE